MSTARPAAPLARSDSADQVADSLLREQPGARALICFPLPRAGAHDQAARFAALLQRGFARVKVGDTVVELADDLGRPVALPPELEGRPMSVVLDRVVINPESRRRLTDSLETALAEGGGEARVDVVSGPAVSISREFRCPDCGTALSSPRPVLFSYNHPVRGA